MYIFTERGKKADFLHNFKEQDMNKIPDYKIFTTLSATIRLGAMFRFVIYSTIFDPKTAKNRGRFLHFITNIVFLLNLKIFEKIS